MELVIDASRVQELAELWQRAPQIVQEEVLKSVTEADVLVQSELMLTLPAGAGATHGAGLKESIFHTEEARAEAVIGMVSTDRGYAQYLETGTRPYQAGRMPPIQPIADWVEAVLGLRAVEVKSRKGKTYLGGEGGSAAFAIAKHIAAKGLTKNPVWQKAYEKLLPKVQALISQGIDRAAARLSGNQA